MAVSYSEPVHKKVNEKWEEVDNTLIATTDKNGKVRYRARNPINEISFSKTLEDDLVSMECDGNSISWGLKVIRQEKGEKGQALSGGKQKREGLRRAEAVICKSDLSTLTEEEIQTLADKSTSTIRYNDVLEGGVDLEYLVLPSQVKENIILNAPQDITAYIVNVQTNNLSARLLEDNQVEFLNGSKVVFTMWSPYMYDSAGELSEDIKVELQDKGSGNFTISMTPDAQWLNDSKRVYPVTIDPTATTSRARSNIIDNYVLEGKGVQNYNLDRLYIGKRSGLVARAYIRYAEMPSLPMNAQIYQTTHRVNILSGTSTANTANAYLVGANWSSSTIKWSNKPSANTLLAQNISHNNRTYYSFYANTAIRKWYNCSQDSVVRNPNGTTNNYGIMMRYNNESINDYNAFYSADYSVESQRPRMTIVYNIMPTPTPKPTPTPTPTPNGSIVWPLPGYYTITSYWGFRSRNGVVRIHRGIDIPTNRNPNVTIIAATSGTVKHSYGDSTGYAVTIKSNGDNSFWTRYFHIKKYGYLTQDGAKVKAGDEIAIAGTTGDSTGIHLHFQLQWGDENGQVYNPLKEYNDDDKRYGSTNPNPMFIKEGGVYVVNPNYELPTMYVEDKYNSTSEEHKK
jgi:murein DD-endopeptidase MepM/ murein hydrolase activator NlpD